MNNMNAAVEHIEPKHKGYVVITLVSRKGGTGKSSTVVNLAQALRICSKRVAIIDADDQQSVVSWENEVKVQKRDVRWGEFFPDIVANAYSAKAIENIFDAFDNDPEWSDLYDYIFIDMAGHLNQIREGGLTTELYDAVLKNTDMLIMVNNPDVFSVQSNKIGCELIEERISVLGTNVALRSLLNNVPAKENSGVRKAIADFKNLENNGQMWRSFENQIQNSRRVGSSLTEGSTSFIPVREKIADSYYSLMNEIIGDFGISPNIKLLGERKRAINKLVNKKNFQ